MATVTGFTAERMLIIENASIVDGDVVGDNLILKRKDGSEIDAGNIRGPTGEPGITEVEFLDQSSINSPIGSIVDYIGVVPPINWLSMEGQTIINGQTLYPLLWGIIPLTMKLGSDIVMPDTRGKVSAGYNSIDTDFNTIGEIGGSKTHLLTKAELPASSVSIDPPNTLISIDPPNTNVYIDPPICQTNNQTTAHSHTFAAQTSDAGDHNHAQYVTSDAAGGPGIRVDMLRDSPGGSAFYPQGITTSYSGDHVHGLSGISGFESGVHQHAIDIPAFNASVDIPSFNAAVDIAPFNSGNLGSGQAHSILQPYVTFLKIIKAA